MIKAIAIIQFAVPQTAANNFCRTPSGIVGNDLDLILGEPNLELAVWQG